MILTNILSMMKPMMMPMTTCMLMTMMMAMVMVMVMSLLQHAPKLPSAHIRHQAGPQQEWAGEHHRLQVHDNFTSLPPAAGAARELRQLQGPQVPGPIC